MSRRWGIGWLYRRIVDYVDELCGGGGVVGSILVNKTVRRGDGDTSDYVLFVSVGMPAQVPANITLVKSFSGSNIAPGETCMAIVGVGGVNRSTAHRSLHLHHDGDVLTTVVGKIEENSQIILRSVIRRILERPVDPICQAQYLNAHIISARWLRHL